MSVDEWDTGQVPRTDIADPGKQVPVPEKLRVLVLSGPDQGKQLILERGTYFVGKAPGCDLVLSDGAVSRQHLELQVSEGGVLVKDLGSTNGAWFGGAQKSAPCTSAGGGLSKYLQQRAVATRPRGVRWRKPSCMRKGS